MFYQVNASQYINLDNVSYISLKDHQGRAIVIFNYSVRLKSVQLDGKMKMIGDYIYIDDREKFASLATACKNAGFKHIVSGSQDILVNPKNISSIKAKERYVVVNFNTPVTFTDKKGDNSQLTAQFVYIDTTKDTQQHVIDVLTK